MSCDTITSHCCNINYCCRKCYILFWSIKYNNKRCGIKTREIKKYRFLIIIKPSRYEYLIDLTELIVRTIRYVFLKGR